MKPDAAGDPALLMDRMYRPQRAFYDLTRKPYLLGRDRLIDGLAPPQGGTVLEIGCGTARNLVEAARRWPEARFFGLDVSAAMLETAEGNVRRAGFGGRIALRQADATRADAAALFGTPTFDRVMISYALSMIPDWPVVATAALRLLAPAGELHVVDFGRQERLPRAFRAMLFSWLALFSVTPLPDLEARLGAAAAAAGRTLRITALHRGYATLAVVR